MKQDRYRAGRRFWSADEDATLRREYPDTPTAPLAVKLRRSIASVYQRVDKLGLHKSAAYLSGPHACRLRRGCGSRTRFQKGHVPANKGLRRPGWAPGRMRETQFKHGVRQGVAVRLYKPIGAERISKDGYRERKINDDLPLQKRWRGVHLILWEAAHGRLPTGHAIIFVNGDRADVRLDNLACITRRELMARNTVHNYPKPLALAVQLLGALNRQIRGRTAHAQQDR